MPLNDLTGTFIFEYEIGELCGCRYTTPDIDNPHLCIVLERENPFIHPIKRDQSTPYFVYIQETGDFHWVYEDELKKL